MENYRKIGVDESGKGDYFGYLVIAGVMIDEKTEKKLKETGVKDSKKLTDPAALSLATIIENQIPTSWSNTSISISVNLGRFTAGQTAYLFVIDSSGSGNAAGFPIVVGNPASSFPAPANPRVF